MDFEKCDLEEVESMFKWSQKIVGMWTITAVLLHSLCLSLSHTHTHTHTHTCIPTCLGDAIHWNISFSCYIWATKEQPFWDVLYVRPLLDSYVLFYSSFYFVHAKCIFANNICNCNQAINYQWVSFIRSVPLQCLSRLTLKWTQTVSDIKLGFVCERRKWWHPYVWKNKSKSEVLWPHLHLHPSVPDLITLQRWLNWTRDDTGN